MKTLSIKFRAIVLITSLIAVFGLWNCGQGDKSKETDTGAGPANNEVKTPVATIDSVPAVPVSPVNTEVPAIKEPAVNTEVKKEPVPSENPKLPVAVKKPEVVQPVVNNTKPAPVNNVIPVTEKPVVKPVETPVVTVTEPEKPKTETPVKPVEVTKPVVVVNTQPEPGDWIVPAKYKTMTSPYATGPDALALGKTVYATHCKSCHGTKGDGNGPKAAQLDTKIGSFLSGEFLSQKPGEVYYKTTFGRKDMPKFEKKIADDEERWAVVYYIMHMKN